MFRKWEIFIIIIAVMGMLSNMITIILAFFLSLLYVGLFRFK